MVFLSTKKVFFSRNRSLKNRVKGQSIVRCDGHSAEDWASYGYGVTTYDDAAACPLAWDVAIKYGRCLLCGFD